jgi:hypothetical protein
MKILPEYVLIWQQYLLPNSVKFSLVEKNSVKFILVEKNSSPRLSGCLTTVPSQTALASK